MNDNYNLLYFSIAFAVCCTVYNFVDVKPIDLYGIHISAGFALVACSYVLSDCITELYGWKVMLKVLITTVILHLITIFAVKFACMLPPNSNWGLNEAYISILGQSSTVAILSAFAFLTGTSTNAFVMDKLKSYWNGKYFRCRAVLSTIAGEFVDCVAFLPFMYYGVLPIMDIIDMILVYTVVKCSCEVIVLPITSFIVNKLK